MKPFIALIFASLLCSFCQSQNSTVPAPTPIISNPEMDSIIEIIRYHYREDEEFLLKLENAQSEWRASVWADIDMRFPKSDKREYGSIYRTCIQLLLDDAINLRLQYLNLWIEGVEEGSVCAGSILVR